jgi:hypothetical protein
MAASSNNQTEQPGSLNAGSDPSAAIASISGRSRGRPPVLTTAADIADPPSALPPLTPVERRAFDYSELEHCMMQLNQAIRHTKHVLDALVAPKIESALLARQTADASVAAEPGPQIDRMEPYV